MADKRLGGGLYHRFLQSGGLRLLCLFGGIQRFPSSLVPDIHQNGCRVSYPYRGAGDQGGYGGGREIGGDGYDGTFWSGLPGRGTGCIKGGYADDKRKSCRDAGIR